MTDQSFSRRQFLTFSSIALAGCTVAPSLTGAGETKTPFQSGLITGKPLPLRHPVIPGFLSAAQLAPHYHAHYGGALRGYLRADAEIQAGKIQDMATYGSLQRARGNKANSVLLHELYFDAMSPLSTQPGEALRQALNRRFGTLEKWMKDFQACANSASGWAVLTFDAVNGKLYNVLCDKHATGPMWMGIPLLALDVYEHAYYVDYQNRKGDYIVRFMEHINWEVVGERYQDHVI